jgi:hypothetical protein
MAALAVILQDRKHIFIESWRRRGIVWGEFGLVPGGIRKREAGYPHERNPDSSHERLNSKVNCSLILAQKGPAGTPAH